MAYDPFSRGAHPVGVRTMPLRDKFSDTETLLELWYPATERFRGQDLDEATRDRFDIAYGIPHQKQDAVRDCEALSGVLPLVLYQHGGYGHRRESTSLCSHLASHGYLVAAADFTGDNIADQLPKADGSAPAIAKTPIDESARRRPEQASFFLDQISSMPLGSGVRVNAARIGSVGASMGGYTTLALNSVDRRPSASFAICPMFGERSPIPQIRRLQRLLRVDNWQRSVQTFLLTGEVDPLIIVDDIRLLFRRLATPKRLAVLARAGHVHFGDHAEAVHERMRLAYLSGLFPDPEIDAIALGTAMRPFSELCPERDSNATMRALCLAHMDAHLKDDPQALAFLDTELAATFAARGIELAEVKQDTGRLTTA